MSGGWSSVRLCHNFSAHRKRQRLMWHTRGGGRAPRAHTLLPLPHCPTSSLPINKLSSLLSCSFSPHFLSPHYCGGEDGPLSGCLAAPPPPPLNSPPLFTFLTATIFESPSGLLFSLSLRFQFIPICRLALSQSPCVSAASC